MFKTTVSTFLDEGNFLPALESYNLLRKNPQTVKCCKMRVSSHHPSCPHHVLIILHVFIMSSSPFMSSSCPHHIHVLIMFSSSFMSSSCPHHPSCAHHVLITLHVLIMSSSPFMSSSCPHHPSGLNFLTSSVSTYDDVILNQT